MNAPPLPLVVNLLRTRGLVFTRDYLYRNYAISGPEVSRLLEAARKVRYQHWMSTRILLENGSHK